MSAAADSGAAYAGWCVAGAGLCLGVLTLLTVGPFVLLATFVLCGWLLWRLDFGWGMAGLPAGAAVPLLYVAWLNRHGPGAVCSGTSRALRCSDEWSPWPFVVAAVLLLVLSLVVFRRRGRG